MATTPQEILLEGITFADNLPINWEILSTLPSEGELNRDYRTNEELLQHLLLRDDAVAQESDEGEVDSTHEHFKRLESRLDLLLSLITEMMTSNGKLPSLQRVTIGGRGLCVQAQEEAIKGLKKETPLKITLYLDPQFPRPLTVFAQLIDVQAQAFTVSFCPLEERLQDLLDKYVFRQHRRAIALARRSESS